ncbi:MAG TPA: hypothetical protein VE196_09660 [Pseudonocardiaceae bacterium]|nr:hypothetical protein [Pseudonocardiaceae bacterium]
MLVRGALDSAALAAVVDQATPALVRCGVADRRCGLHWTDAPVPDLDDIGLNHTQLSMISCTRSMAARMPCVQWPTECAATPCTSGALHIFATVPDDPSHVTAPHQDNFAVNTTGDYRRLWIALTDIPFGDGGLGLAIEPASPGSARAPRTPRPWACQRPLAHRKLGTGRPHRVPPDVVHRGLPPTSDRIRMALAVIVSARSDPLPHTMYTGPENRARHNYVRELAAPLGFSDLELFSVTADLTRAGVAIEEETVRAAARGDYSRRSTSQISARVPRGWPSRLLSFASSIAQLSARS